MKLKNANGIAYTMGLCCLFLLTACQNDNISIEVDGQTVELTADEYLNTVKDAYLYAYPLVLMDISKNVITGSVIAPDSVRAIAPMNQIGHYRRFPDHTLTAIVKPNVDTYYSSAWLDLKKEPLLFHMPPTNRYYLLPFYDAYSNVFASPGTRMGDTTGLNLMVVGPDWKGDVLENYQLIKSPTNMAWMLGRIQVNNDEDGATFVRNLQDQMQLLPISAKDNPDYVPPKGNKPKGIDGMNAKKSPLIPSKAIAQLGTADYLNRLAVLMKDNPPLAKDSNIVQRMRKIGLEAGKPFSINTNSFVLNQKLNFLPSVVHKRFAERKANPDTTRMVNQWMFVTDSIGDYGDSYLFRAYINHIGFGANLTEDAVYPNTTRDVNGEALDGAKKYRIHINKTDLPPVNAFWSLTAYNADEFLVESEINRYAITDRDELFFNPDLSLDIYIQSEKPADPKHKNWLPVPKEGAFSLTMRLYHPKEAVYNGDWIPPSVMPE